jgi:hypothetical protein
VRIADSAKVFFVGSIWKLAGAVSGLATAVGVVQALDDKSLGTLWMWLFFAALALVAASFYSFHLSRMQIEAKKKSLPSKIDDLHREGIDLFATLSAPVEPQKTENGWSIAIADAPSAWWDKAVTFDQRIRDLFIEQYPALLTNYAAGANDHLRRAREAREAINPENDKRSDTEKMRDFANYARGGPARRVEASLEGLAVARHQAGISGPPNV